MKIAAIDYSISSPCVCVYDDEVGDFEFKNCEFWFLTDTKKFLLFENKIKNIHGCSHNGEFRCLEERYEQIADWTLDKVSRNDTTFMEGFSFGSSGRVFDVAGSTYILRYKFWKEFNRNPELVPPSSIKKFATNNGNAKKEDMFDSFKKVTHIDIATPMKANPAKSPISDIVDSSWLASLAVFRTKSNTV